MCQYNFASCTCCLFKFHLVCSGRWPFIVVGFFHSHFQHWFHFGCSMYCDPRICARCGLLKEWKQDWTKSQWKSIWTEWLPDDRPTGSSITSNFNCCRACGSWRAGLHRAAVPSTSPASSGSVPPVPPPPSRPPPIPSMLQTAATRNCT